MQKVIKEVLEHAIAIDVALAELLEPGSVELGQTMRDLEGLANMLDHYAAQTAPLQHLFGVVQAAHGAYAMRQAIARLILAEKRARY